MLMRTRKDLTKPRSRTKRMMAARRAFRIRTALNAAVFDSVMVGLARRLKHGHIEDWAEVADAYGNLLSDPDYEGAIRKATANEENVATRLRLATQAFADVH